MATQIVDAEYVLEHIGKEFILDLRPEFMYNAFHVPGAKGIDFWFYKTQNVFTMPIRLMEFVTEMGASKDEPIIVYCYEGIMSEDATSMLESQGFTEVRHYSAGWKDWVSDPSRPTEG